MFTKVNIPFYDLACRHSENCVENKSIAMSCGEYVLRTNEVFSLEKNKRMRYYVPCKLTVAQQPIRQAEFISASGFRNKFAVTGWDVKGQSFPVRKVKIQNKLKERKI